MIHKLTLAQLQSLIWLAKYGISGMPSNRSNARQLNALTEKKLARWFRWSRHTMRYQITESGTQFLNDILLLWNRPAAIVHARNKRNPR